MPIDYKKIFKTPESRYRVLNMLRFIPDKPMLELQYRIKTGRKLNLKNPQRFTEKLQWYKLYYRDPLMIQCVDKYDVRQYVESKGLGHILNECYGVYERVEDIDFGALPQQFVLKDTLGGGGNSVIICRDKNTFDIDNAKAQMRKWLQSDTGRSGGREWPNYSGKIHRIYIEELLPRDNRGDLPDYKFFCFSGTPNYLYTMIDYTDCHQNGKCSFFDMDYNILPYRRSEFEPIACQPPIPQNFKDMANCAELLCKDFPHVRVDLYNINGNVRFGELTFYSASGYTVFTPDEFDEILGAPFVLPEKRIKL